MTYPGGGRNSPGPRVSAIVLAAGESKRMGAPKPLVEVAGKPLLEHVLSWLSKSKVDDVIIVLGSEAERIRAGIELGRATIVVNPDFREGLSTSIRAGLRAAHPPADAYLLVLADQPFVMPQTVDAIVKAWAHVRPPIAVPTFRQQRGNPVLVRRDVAATIDRITGDTGFRAIMGEQGRQVVEVPVDDPGILLDVDSPDQVRAIEGALSRGESLEAVVRELATGARPSP